MTMGDELPVTSLVLPVLIRPVLTQLEKYDLGASQTLRAALTKAESAVPGLNYDLVAGIMRRADIPVNMNESLLRLQGTLTDTECADLRLTRSEEAFQELNKKSTALKKILSRIPDEITDRKTFLETIKEIASAIKKLLDAVNEVSTYTPGPGKQVLEQRKREFVKYSKRFSNTLKEYFKEGHRKTSTAEHRPPSTISNMSGPAPLASTDAQQPSPGYLSILCRYMDVPGQCSICECTLPDLSNKPNIVHSEEQVGVDFTDVQIDAAKIRNMAHAHISLVRLYMHNSCFILFDDVSAKRPNFMK